MSSEAGYDANTWTEEDETEWAWRQVCSVFLLSPFSSAERSDVLALGAVEEPVPHALASFEFWVGWPVQLVLSNLVDRRMNMRVTSLKRMGAGGAAGSVDSKTVNTVVRKLGHVLRTAAHVMRDNLNAVGDREGVQRLGATLFPLVDALCAFDVNADVVDDDEDEEPDNGDA